MDKRASPARTIRIANAGSNSLSAPAAQNGELQPFRLGRVLNDRKEALHRFAYCSGSPAGRWSGRRGTSSDSSSSRFGYQFAGAIVIPVRLPPGRAKLATRPAATGSPPIRTTIGIIAVASFAARAAERRRLPRSRRRRDATRSAARPAVDRMTLCPAIFDRTFCPRHNRSPSARGESGNLRCKAVLRPRCRGTQ